MRRAAARQLPDEAQREFLLRRMQVREEDAAVDLMDVHDQDLGPVHITLLRRSLKDGLDRNSI
jgi:hypothetical protein